MRSVLTALGLLGFLATAAPAAETCEPLANLVVEAERLHAEVEIIREGENGPVNFVEVYSSNLGLPLPADANPVGVFFAFGPNGVFVGLIEDPSCVRYSVAVPKVLHERAYLASKTGV